MPALVTVELWQAVAPHLPAHPSSPKGGRPRVADRSALAWILFILREGLRWRSLPTEMMRGSGNPCWRRCAEWTAPTVWNRAHEYLLAALGDQWVLNLERAVFDSAGNRAVKGGHTRLNPTDGAKKGLKRHLLTDANGLPLVLVGPANRRDEHLVGPIQ